LPTTARARVESGALTKVSRVEGGAVAARAAFAVMLLNPQ